MRCKHAGRPDCRGCVGRAGQRDQVSDPGGMVVKCHAQRIKTPGMAGLISPESTSAGRFGASMSSSSHPGRLQFGHPKGTALSPIKSSTRAGVQTSVVVRFPYLSCARKGYLQGAVPNFERTGWTGEPLVHQLSRQEVAQLGSICSRSDKLKTSKREAGLKIKISTGVNPR